jgi:hypothetical protein
MRKRRMRTEDNPRSLFTNLNPRPPAGKISRGLSLKTCFSPPEVGDPGRFRDIMLTVKMAVQLGFW